MRRVSVTRAGLGIGLALGLTAGLTVGPAVGSNAVAGASASFAAGAATARAPRPAGTPALPAPSLRAAAAFDWLRPGDRGERVRKVQRALRKRGYRIAADGRYGPATRAAVRKFQRRHRLRASGHVGPQTWRALGLVRTTPPTTTTLPPNGYRHPRKSVERWHATALEIGWPEAQWKKLSCIINRESHGYPAARNASGAMGLLQIVYRAHRSRVGPNPAVLLEGATNLRIGLQIYRASGWRPWGGSAVCA